MGRCERKSRNPLKNGIQASKPKRYHGKDVSSRIGNAGMKRTFEKFAIGSGEGSPDMDVDKGTS
jgi:hypothetical protein